MIISIIVAASENNVIGIDNQLPWKLPGDMQFFKNTTWGHPMVMGRKTFESLDGSLKGRQNIVITRQQDYSYPGTIIVPSLEEGVRAAEAQDTHEIFIAGGGEIFKQAMPIVDRIYLTRVHTTLQGDAYFMGEALRQARRAYDREEVPVGAVVARGDAVLASAGNRTRELADPTAHAEMLAIREACRALAGERLTGCDLYVTLEPCAMCAGAISFARLRRLYFGAGDEKGGAVVNGARFFSLPTCHHAPDVYPGIGEGRAAMLLKDFFRDRREANEPAGPGSRE